MNSLYKLVMVLVCATLAVSAAVTLERIPSDIPGFDKVDLVTGKIIPGEPAVVVSDVTKNGEKQDNGIQGEDVENNGFTHKKSIDLANKSLASTNEINSWCTSTYCKNVPANTKWMWGGAVASWGITIGLVCYECGYGACDPGGAAMVCAYIFGGFGTVLAAGGYYGFNTQDDETLYHFQKSLVYYRPFTRCN